MHNAVAAKCHALVFNDRQDAADTSEIWIKIYCRHWATVNKDSQTLDNLNSEERIIARQHLAVLRRANRLKEGGFKANFETLPRQSYQSLTRTQNTP